jgi:hypothetical protein
MDEAHYKQLDGALLEIIAALDRLLMKEIPPEQVDKALALLKKRHLE